MEHGADLLTYKDQYDGELIDYSSNINPLGPPKGLKDVILDSLGALTTYPDIKYRNLKQSISKYLKCEKENVLVGNGAVEIINNFIIPANRVIVVQPSFSEYEKRAIANGKEVVKTNYADDFSIDLDSLNEIQKDDLLILGNPNNPTGLRIPKDELMNIYNLVRYQGGFLLLDEAFFEFCPEDYDSIKIFKEFNYENIGIIRAATKFFALPGIRLGYGCTSSKKCEEIKKIEQPWSVNSFADAAGQFIFKDEEYIKESKRYIEEERNFLLNELSKIEGISVYNTSTNYILIKLLNWKQENIFNFFLKNGILIRKCTSFEGLDTDHIRIAIKDRENNLKLLEVFSTVPETEIKE